MRLTTHGHSHTQTALVEEYEFLRKYWQLGDQAVLRGRTTTPLRASNPSVRFAAHFPHSQK